MEQESVLQRKIILINKSRLKGPEARGDRLTVVGVQSSAPGESEQAGSGEDQREEGGGSLPPPASDTPPGAASPPPAP